MHSSGYGLRRAVAVAGDATGETAVDEEPEAPEQESRRAGAAEGGANGEAGDGSRIKGLRGD